jgi:ASC-1-like (ASCH) protein
MTTYIQHLSEPWFSLIKLNIKKVEGRLNKGTFAKMKIGDYIIFENSDFDLKRTVKVKIKNIIEYESFKQYLEKEKLERCLPGISNINDGIKIYRKYYSKSQEIEFKILAIKIKQKKINN